MVSGSPGGAGRKTLSFRKTGGSDMVQTSGSWTPQSVGVPGLECRPLWMKVLSDGGCLFPRQQAGRWRLCFRTVVEQGVWRTGWGPLMTFDPCSLDSRLYISEVDGDKWKSVSICQEWRRGGQRLRGGVVQVRLWSKPREGGGRRGQARLRSIHMDVPLGGFTLQNGFL